MLLGWVGYRVWGMSPWMWHAFTLALHVLCSLEVFYLGKLLSHRDDFGFLAAVIFSVYPRHHEPVLWLAANQFL